VSTDQSVTLFLS